MTRPGLSAIYDAAISAANVPYIIFVELQFDDVLRVSSAGYNITWADNEWLGIGFLGSIDAIVEQASLEASTISLSLSGVPSEMVAIALAQQYQGNPCNIYFAALADDLSMQDDPMRIYRGRIDTMVVDVGESASITVTVESRLASWERARVRRFNHADQISRYPDDLGLEYVAQMVEKELRWG